MLKLKSNLFAKDGAALGDAIQAMIDQIGSGNNQGWIEKFPLYGGSWSIEPDQPRYSDAELDDLSTIPFGK
jgi:hypothetical protein